MELNAEKVKKDLERDIRVSIALNYEFPSITYSNLRNALALINSQEQRIKELTEENERLRGRHQWDWTKFYCNGRKGVCDIGNWINGSCKGCWYYDGKGGHYLYESTRERKERNV